MQIKSKYLLYILLVVTSCTDSPAPQQAILPVNDSTRNAISNADTSQPAPVSTTISPTALDSLEQTNAAMVSTDDEHIQKAQVSREDSSVWLTANMRLDHRIFGYAQPDVHSKKMMLISIFTNDVKDNPFGLPYGAYYQVNDADGIKLKYTGDEGSFIRAEVSLDGTTKGPVYIERRWITFDD